MARTKQTARKSELASATKKVPRVKQAKAVAKKPVAGGGGGGGPGLKKPHRFKPGTVALRDIRKLQRDTNPLLKVRPMYRLVKELIQDLPNSENIRLGNKAILALMAASEDEMVKHFMSGQEAAIHAGRITVQPRDLHLGIRMRVINPAPHLGNIGATDKRIVMPQRRQAVADGTTAIKKAKKVTDAVFNKSKKMIKPIQPVTSNPVTTSTPPQSPLKQKPKDAGIKKKQKKNGKKFVVTPTASPVSSPKKTIKAKTKKVASPVDQEEEEGEEIEAEDAFDAVPQEELAEIEEGDEIIEQAGVVDEWST